MADRIIKGDSGNDVVIQNNGGSRKIEVTDSGDVEVTGDVKTTTVKATNLKANDGTASLVVADSTGEVTSSGGLKAVNLKTTNLKANDGTAGLSIADSTGRVTVTETNPVITLGSNTTFAIAGCVIKTLTFETSNGATTDSDVFIPLDSANTSIQVPDYTKGNKLLIWTSIHYKIREGTDFSILLQSYYQTSSSTGAGTPSTSSPWVQNNNFLGKFATVVATTENTEDSTTLLDIITVSGTTNIDYGIYLDRTGTGIVDIEDQKRFIVIQEIQA